ncbi:MAG: molecular chaperone DnaJ [Rhodospirillales bacterium]|jgi:hypothetical protein|nr:molecular chaperone DnaJ [Rhodospirillales bacterium]
MAYIALVGIILLVLFLLLRWFVNANPAVLARGFGWGLAIVAIAAIVLLYATEALGPALALTGAFLTVVLRGHALWRYFRGLVGPAAGNVSEVETDYLRMTLDHDSGTMEGTVRRGTHQGRRLSELSAPELVALWRECRAEDAASAKLLETYLDRIVPGWRDGAGHAGGGDGAGPAHAAAMTREEAYAILGIAQGASADEVKAAYHRLMLKLHPDHGGSTYLAARINAARDLLLKG